MDIDTYWAWAFGPLVEQLYVDVWYNDQVMKKGKEEDIIADRNSVLVGMPRLRQLRVQKGEVLRNQAAKNAEAYKLFKLYASYKLLSENVNCPG